jgi:hypothetical protein
MGQASMTVGFCEYRVKVSHVVHEIPGSSCLRNLPQDDEYCVCDAAATKKKHRYPANTTAAGGGQWDLVSAA